MSLAIALDEANEPPKEFRIFVAGWNDSENGRVLFDAKAAAMTMAAFEKQDVDRMIDLEHLSLDQESNAFDPDARGWARLELREDGSLWAVDVKWTDDGAERIRSKKQRFISPAFMFDDDKRVTKILNIGLTALPATHGIPELIAARVNTIGAQRNTQNMLTPEQAAAALEAVKSEDATAALDLLDLLLRAMLAGPEAAPVAAPDEVPDGEELASHEEEEELKANAEETESANEVAAATSRLMRLTDQPTLGQAVEQAAVFRESHMLLAEKTKKLEDERRALQLKERKALAVKLTQLGAETPNTTGLNVGKLCDRLMNEPLKSLRARVAELTDANKGSKRHARGASDGDADADSGIQEQLGDGDGEIQKTKDNPFGLSKTELGYCAQYKCEPEVYARLKRGKDAN